MRCARWFFRPKKTSPFQRVPVMARAMAESDLIGPALILEVVVAHGDAVLDALPFADQPRAGDRPVHWRGCAAPGRVAAVELLGERLAAASTVSGFSPP